MTLKDKYRFYKLTNGEDIIVEVIEENDTTVTITNALKVLVDSDLDAGKQMIFMYNWIPHGVVAEKHIVLTKNMICINASVDPEILQHYVNVVEDMEQSEKKVETKKNESKYIDNEKKVVSISDMFKNPKSIE